MTVTIEVIGNDLNFPRSYVSGFVGSSGISDMAITSGFLTFGYFSGLYQISLKIRPNVLTPTSNRYTIGYVFDADASTALLSGVPVDITVGVAFYAMRSEQTWRIRVLATLDPDEENTVDWQPLANYWRPLD